MKLLQILVDPVPMGDLIYDYLTQWTDRTFAPQFYDGFDHPLLIDDTSGMGSPPLGYVSEQPTFDFSIPSPLYVAKPLSPLYSLKILSQVPKLPPLHPLTTTFRNIYSGTSTAAITPTRIEVPPSKPVLREYTGEVVLRRLLERLPWALGV